MVFIYSGKQRVPYLILQQQTYSSLPIGILQTEGIDHTQTDLLSLVPVAFYTTRGSASTGLPATDFSSLLGNTL